jgi:hypothetical protein
MCLNLTPDDMHNMQYLVDHFGLEDDDLPVNAFPLQYKFIAFHQHKQPELLKKLKNGLDGYHIKSFCRGSKKGDLICHNDKIVIPTILQRHVAEWYHTTLCHPGETRTEQTLHQYLWWPKLRDEVHDICTKCHVCQKTKCTSKKYGHLPPKEAESTPWDVLCVDLIGPYTIK